MENKVNPHFKKLKEEQWKHPNKVDKREFCGRVLNFPSSQIFLTGLLIVNFSFIALWKGAVWYMISASGDFSLWPNYITFYECPMGTEKI